MNIMLATVAERTRANRHSTGSGAGNKTFRSSF